MSFKIICITSDGYRHLMPEFAERFNRFYSDKLAVDVLCYKYPDTLPVNFNVRSLGVQPENKDWTSGLIEYFKNLDSTYFMLFLDDYFINSKVDVQVVDSIYQFMLDNIVEKFDLTLDRARFPYIYTKWPFIIKSKCDARYRSSLQAAIWSTRYFRDFLIAGRTPWEFELIGEKEAMNDGAVIMGSTCGIIRYDNAMKRGNKL